MQLGRSHRLEEIVDMASDSSRGGGTDHDQTEREQREYQPSSPGREPHSQELSSSRREGVAGTVMNSAGSTISVTPVLPASPESVVMPRMVITKAPRNGSSASSGRSCVATSSTPMTMPRRAAAPTSPHEATTLGANPAAKSATPITRYHHGHCEIDQTAPVCGLVIG